MTGRAVLLFKLREAEKTQGLGEAIPKPSDAGGEARCDIVDQMDDAVAQAGHHLGADPLRTRLASSPIVTSRR